MLDDRIRFFEGRPQRYATQLDWDAEGNLSPGEVEDPQRLPERRLGAGLPPLEERIEEARRRAASEGERPPADHQAYASARDAWAARVGWRAGREIEPDDTPSFSSEGNASSLPRAPRDAGRD